MALPYTHIIKSTVNRVSFVCKFFTLYVRNFSITVFLSTSSVRHILSGVSIHWIRPLDSPLTPKMAQIKSLVEDLIHSASVFTTCTMYSDSGYFDRCNCFAT